MQAWGCPECQSPVSKVRDTGRDEEDYKVRLRECVTCSALWATEETPISVSAFYARNNSRRVARAQRERALGYKECVWCGARYMAGGYSDHVRRSTRHAKALRPTNRDRQYRRRYGREWMRRRREAA
jgi:hypothetical protein